MKKMPTLFIRVFYDHSIIDTINEVTPGCEWVLAGEGVATEKLTERVPFSRTTDSGDAMTLRKGSLFLQMLSLVSLLLTL